MIRVTIDVRADMQLNESECRALEALVGYGDDAFIKAFKDSLGKHYIRDHEAGLRSVFSKIRSTAIPALRRVDDTRRVIAKADGAER